MKVLSVFGTRPEAIKMAPVLRAFQNVNAKIESVVCVTAQHREILDQVLTLFSIRPDYDLDLMRPGQTPLQVAAQVLEQIEKIIYKEKPDWVLVQGDTTTAMAASLAAFYSGARVGHVEAGLRTYHKREPFPEEINRRLTGVIADLHFAPTALARQHLLNEGVPEAFISITGNPVIDALHWAVAQPYAIADGPLKHIPWECQILLITAHRRESFGTPLDNICIALRMLASQYHDQVHIVFPVHPNPKVKEPVYRHLSSLPNVTLTEPLEYLPLAHLMQRSHFVLTDSGGLQEEAPSLGKPVLVLRNRTERQEAIDAGTAMLVGTDVDRIVEASRRLITEPTYYTTMAQAQNPYGDGKAAQRICQTLLEHSSHQGS